jgi:xanthine/uracil permease
MQQTRDDRSLGDLFADLARELSTLMRQELALARTELSEKASQAGKDLAFLAAGGAVIYAGFLAVLAAVIVLLASNGLAWWLAALLVGVIVLGVGYGLVHKGLNDLKRQDFAPRQTLESIKEDAQFVKEQA